MNEKAPANQRPQSEPSLLFVIIVLVAIGAAMVLATAPFTTLVGPSAYAVGGALHGLFGFLLLVVMTIGLYIGWSLFVGRFHAFSDLPLITTVMATLAFLTIVFGNWIYIAYRSLAHLSHRVPIFLRGCRKSTRCSLNLRNTPRCSRCRSPWRPLSLCGATAGGRSWSETGHALPSRSIIALNFFYFVVAFVLGAAVTKLKSI